MKWISYLKALVSSTRHYEIAGPLPSGSWLVYEGSAPKKYEEDEPC